MNTKETNPKDMAAIGKRVSFSALPTRALVGPTLALNEGAHKYGRHNYRVAGVLSSVYYDAMSRHLYAWWEGEDIDPKSHLHHLDKMIAGALVLRDAMLGGMCTDDRPPSISVGWIEEANDATAKLGERMREEHGESLPPFTHSDTMPDTEPDEPCTDPEPDNDDPLYYAACAGTRVRIMTEGVAHRGTIREFNHSAIEPQWRIQTDGQHTSHWRSRFFFDVAPEPDSSPHDTDPAPPPSEPAPEQDPLYTVECVGLRVRCSLPNAKLWGLITAFDDEQSTRKWRIKWASGNPPRWHNRGEFLIEPIEDNTSDAPLGRPVMP